MKIMKFFGVALVATVLSAGICACSDDDDASSPSSEGAVIRTTDGDRLLLTSIKNGSYNNIYRFDYDDEGRCTYVYGECWEYDISYNPYRIVDDDDDNLSFTFNGSGYVTKISCNVSEKGSGWEFSASVTVSISYDGDHPTKITDSWSGKEVEDGDKYTYSGSSTATLTWKDGNMTKMNFTYKESDSDGDSWNETDSYTYKYGDTENEYRQHTLALNEAYYEIDFMEDLGFIGYFGKGTSQLPTSCEKVWEEDDYSDTYSETFTYTKNSDGTIKTEKMNNTTYTYSYSTLDSYTRSAVSTFEDAFSTPWNTNVERKPKFDRHSQRHSKHMKTELQ